MPETDTLDPTLDELVQIEDPGFYINDPYPVYARLQREAPVFHYAPLDIFVLTRYEHVREAARRADIFSSGQGSSSTMSATASSTRASRRCSRASSTRTVSSSRSLIRPATRSCAES
jgi:cytochrome P450